MKLICDIYVINSKIYLFFFFFFKLNFKIQVYVYVHSLILRILQFNHLWVYSNQNIKIHLSCTWGEFNY